MTSALSISSLIDLMRDASARTYDPALRFGHEPDEVLFGKVSMLLSIAEPALEIEDLTPEERDSLISVYRGLCRAHAYLSEILSAFLVSAS